jgi:hypothetical protein
VQAEPSNKIFNSKNHQEIEEVLCSRQTMKTQMIQKMTENKEEKSSFNPQPSKEIQNFFFFISFQKRTTRVLSDPLLAARLRFESA